MHSQIEEFRHAAVEVAADAAVARKPRDGEVCVCGEAAVIVFENRERVLPFCGQCE